MARGKSMFQFRRQGDSRAAHSERPGNALLHQFFAQITGQPRVAIYAKGDREFFYKVVDAQVTFQIDSEGKAVAAVLEKFPPS